MPGLPAPGLGPGSPVIWGVLNVTPDSFSDGGRFQQTERALEHGRLLRAQGADVIDVGGESTRPGARRVDAHEEMGRVLPVIEALAAEGTTVSIDTMRADVAAAAVRSGASIVNDVSGGRADHAMHSVVAALGVPYVIMHWRGHSDRMDELADYRDVVHEVRTEIAEQLTSAIDAGIDRASIIIDPGIGFAKGVEHNWAVLRSLDVLSDLGLPLLVGASRKRFLGQLLMDDSGRPRDPDGRDTATAVLNGVLARSARVWGLRVHDVRGTMDAVKVMNAMLGESP